MFFVLTTAGSNYLQAHPGVAPILAGYKLGSGYNYTPSPSDTYLHGTEVHSGVPSAPIVQDYTMFKYTISMDVSVGDFSFGECVLMLPGNIPLAIGTADSLIPKRKATLNTDGNNIVIECYLSNSYGNIAIYAELGNSDVAINVPSFPSLDSLPPAYNAVPNIVQVPAPDPGSNVSALAYSNNARWNITGFDQQVFIEIPALAGSTASRVYFSQAMPLGNVSAMLMQCISGANAGSIRFIAGSGTSPTLGNYFQVASPYLYPVAEGDKFSVVRRITINRYAQAFLDGLEPTTTAAQTNGIQNIDLNKLFFTDGSRPAISNWNMASSRITMLGDPISSRDAVHKQWLQDQIDSFNATVVQAGFNAPKLQFGLGAPSGSTPTAPPFYVDKTTANYYELYVRDHTAASPTWNKVTPARAQYGTGAPTALTPVIPDLYYDTTNSSRFVAYTYRSGAWHMVGQPDQGVNFIGGVTVSDTLDIGVSSATPIRATATGFTSSAVSGINFGMTALGLNATLRNRWPSTYAFTINTSTNETAAYEITRSGSIVGGIRLNQLATELQVGTKAATADVSLIRGDTSGIRISSTGVAVYPDLFSDSTTNTSTFYSNARISRLSGVNITTFNTGVDSTALGSLVVSGNSLPTISKTYGRYNTLINCYDDGGTGSAVHTLTTGIGNTLVGAQAGLGLSTGSHNIILGRASGITTGSDNTIIATNLTGVNGSNSSTVAIGSMLGFGGTSSSSSILIGANSYITGDYGICIGKSSGVTGPGLAIGRSTVSYGEHSLAIGSFSRAYEDCIAFGMYALANVASTGTSNVAVGSYAGSKITSGQGNVAIGYLALQGPDSTTVYTTGAGNVAVGQQAARSITSGYVNVAVGLSALSSITAGSANIAIGDSSGVSLTTGAYNVSIGGSALRGGVACFQNIAIGSSALAATGVLNDNIGIGVQSAYKNVAGENLAIGSYAANNSSTTSAVFLAVGHNALRSASNPQSVVAIGKNSMYNAATPSSVVAIGHNVLQYAQNASSITAVGDGALRYFAPANTVANNITAIGANVASINAVGNLLDNTTIVGAYALTSSSAPQANDSVVIGAEAAKGSLAAPYSVIIGKFNSAYSSTNRSTAIGYSFAADSSDSILITASGGSSGGSRNINNSIFMGCTDGASTTASWNLSSSYIIGCAIPDTSSLSNCIGLGANYIGNTSATNQVTIGNSTHTSYRMYGTWTNVSDARDKKNIVPLKEELGLEFINKLNPVHFEWNMRSGGKEGLKDSGFIAQEVLSAAGDEDNQALHLVETYTPEQLTLAITSLIPSLVKSIQQLSAQVEQLKNK